MTLHSQAGGGVKCEINVTPLVDVCLVLLIIFMVIVPFLQMGYPVATPPVSSEPGPAGNQLILRMDRDGRTFLNRMPVAMGDLPGRLRAALDGRNRMLLFAADGELLYGDVATLMDLCRASGAKKIGVVFTDMKAPT